MTSTIKEKEDKLQDLTSRYKNQDPDDSRKNLSKRLQDKKRLVNKHDKERIELIGKIANINAELNIAAKQKEDYERINSDIRVFDLFIQATSKEGYLSR